MYVAQVGKGRVGRLEGIKDRKNTRNEANGQNRGERERKCNTVEAQGKVKEQNKRTCRFARLLLPYCV